MRYDLAYQHWLRMTLGILPILLQGGGDNSEFQKNAAFWKNPEKIWSNLAKIQQNSGKNCEILEKKQQKFQQFLTKILRLESGAKECIV